VNCDGFHIPGDHPASASYDTSLRGVVTDTITGLTWERTPTAIEATAVSSTFCPTRNTGGLAGWRLPTLLELESIADLAARAPAIDAVAFPETRSSFFASSTRLYMAGHPFGLDGYNWTVSFETGSTVNGLPPSFFIRCVRRASPGACFSTAGRFHSDSVSSTASVIDDMTGLSWQSAVDPAPLTWDQAKADCAARGSGFRLPSLKELLSIVDFTASPVPIDASAFPFTPNQEYWTSSTVAGKRTDAWTMSFLESSSAYTQTASTSDARYVRCVR
jgi:hypothetical protein